MRKIDGIFIHCSATREGVVLRAADIEKMHRARGWAAIGYHRVHGLDGVVEQGRPDLVPGAGVFGHNLYALHIVYIGGLDRNGKAKDTRTQAQKQSLKQDIIRYRKLYPGIKWVKGHRDASPDKNKNGKIDKWEWLKECPCFDVEEWMIEVGI
jgi:N-acetylmuramoyl-L-alanine amidase